MSSPESDPRLLEFMRSSSKRAEREANPESEAVDAKLEQLLDDSERELDTRGVRTIAPEPAQLTDTFKRWRKWTQDIEWSNQHKEAA